MRKKDDLTVTEAPLEGQQRAESITLAFRTQEELDCYDAISVAAAEDERPPSQFLKRYLKLTFKRAPSTETTTDW